MMMKQEAKNTNNKPRASLKVIAFKLPEKQVNSIKSLCDKGFYPSLSETVRIAITDFISHVIDITNQNQSEYWLSISDQDTLTNMSSIKSNKISACTKMPYELLKTIDLLIKSNSKSFSNRTNFIRLAISRFLDKDYEIYSYWLSKHVAKKEVGSDVIANNPNQIHAFQ